MDDQRITVAGKQLLLDGRHLADCATPEAAEVIGICLNHGSLSERFHAAPAALIRRVTEFFA